MANVNDNTSATELPENMSIKCKYCPRTFATSQALGGHQNAHWEEKQNRKRQRPAFLAHLNQSNPDPHPYPHASLNQPAVADLPREIRRCQHVFPPEFEQPYYYRPVVYNQYSRSQNSNFNFVGVQSYPNQVVYDQYNRSQTFKFAGKQSYPNQMVYNHCFNVSQTFNFAGQQSYPSQEMSPDWTFEGVSPILPRPQPESEPQPQSKSRSLMDPSSPVNLDLCLSTKNTSQEPKNITKEMVAGKEDNGPSLSLSVGEKEDDDDPSLSLSLKL